MNTPWRLLLVDDHTLFRRGLKALLASDDRLQVVAEAGDAGQALRLAAELQPDLILLDNHLPGVRGIDALPALREAAPRARVLLLTVSECQHDLAAALRAGAMGYLLKTTDSDALVGAIERAMHSEPTVSPEMTSKLVSAFTTAAPQAAAAQPADALQRLSPREREILGQIAQGASNKAIARTLAIAETTVKIHVQHILRKLELGSRVQAAVYAVSRMT
jgi:two-component system, NarL family, nitrate/nitrite response regulator NarL